MRVIWAFLPFLFLFNHLNSFADHADQLCIRDECQIKRTIDQAIELYGISARLVYEKNRLINNQGRITTDVELFQAIRDYAVVLEEFNDSYENYLNNKTWQFALEKMSFGQRQMNAFNPFGLYVMSGVINIENTFKSVHSNNHHEIKFFKKAIELFFSQIARSLELQLRTVSEAPAVTNMFKAREFQKAAFQMEEGMLTLTYVSHLEIQDMWTYIVFKPVAALVGFGDSVFLATNHSSEELPSLDYVRPKTEFPKPFPEIEPARKILTLLRNDR